MTKRRGPTADQRKEIEMPPLDHQFPAEMGVPQASSIQTQEIEQQQQEYEEPIEQFNRINGIEEEVQEEEPIQLDQVQSEPIKSKPESSQQENFRKVKEARERAERERDALMSQMLEMQAKLQVQQPKQQVVEEEKDWFDGLDPESLVEGKQLKNIAQEMKAMKKQLREQQQQSQDMILQNKLRTQYPDIDSVVNKETIEQLNQLYPIEAAALGEMTNKYSQAVLAYSTIKNLGLIKGQEMKKPAYESDVLRAKVNAAKPRPLASVNPQQGDSPLSKANAFANGLTPDLKAQLNKEMMAARKGH